jgi:tripartite-type tricarboxylate transporter receptor subunit TctC
VSIISGRRKSKAETQPTVSKTRPTRRRPIEAALLHGRLLGVKATELPRRRFLHLAAGAAALPAASHVAWGQTYPTRPVRIIVGTAPGGVLDIGARLIGQWLSERLGRQFIVENRTGGGINVATEVVVKAPPDGYTLLMVGAGNTIGAILYDRLNFVFLRDIAPVASTASIPLVMMVHPSLPVHSVPEFIAYAKANPGKISFGSSLNGSMVQMAGEMFKLMAGVDMVSVPYRGTGPMLIDLVSGQLQVTIADLPPSVQHIRTGSLRALAVTTAERLAVLPGIPAIGEFVPGFEVTAWQGIAQEYTGRYHRQAQPGDQCRPRQPRDQGAVVRSRDVGS